MAWLFYDVDSHAMEGCLGIEMFLKYFLFRNILNNIYIFIF
jgi:hypothetical protein